MRLGAGASSLHSDIHLFSSQVKNHPINAIILIDFSSFCLVVEALEMARAGQRTLTFSLEFELH